MPTIQDFGGCKLQMFADDHNPPHFHIVAADWHATFTVVGCRLLKGTYKLSVAKAALA